MSVSELKNLTSNAVKENVIATLLATAPNVIFVEGAAPHVMAMGRMSAIEAPRVAREDIDDFVRATAPTDAIAELATLAGKTSKDYGNGKRWDTINYGIKTPEHSYRVNYKLSMSGAGVTIQRVSKRSDLPLLPADSVKAESLPI